MSMKRRKIQSEKPYCRVLTGSSRLSYTTVLIACFGSLLFFLIWSAMYAREVDSDYERRINDALGSEKDLWGEELLARPEGPTAENVAGLLSPLMYSGKSISNPEIYYLTFGRPVGPGGGGDAALHVANGSQIISREHLSNSRMDVYVGAGGDREHYGESLDRLESIELLDGYQPVLITHYRDSNGNQYRQESFADALPGTDKLVSFVRIDIWGESDAGVGIRLNSIGTEMRRVENALVGPDRSLLFFSGDPTMEGDSLQYRVGDTSAEPSSLFLVRPNHPVRRQLEIECSEASYLAARERLCRYWDERLATGRLFQVPEEEVMNAQRNLLIQNLFLGWRYSYGSTYETFFQPEGSDSAHLLGVFGFTEENRACLSALIALSNGKESYYNWELGEKLSHAAQYYYLSGDAGFIHQNKLTYDSFIRELASQIDISPEGLLRKERFSGDIEEKDYYLHQQAVCWRGLRDMANVLEELGYEADAESCSERSSRLGKALLSAVMKSKLDLDDGTVFIPTRLLASVKPHLPVTSSRLGTYWNLVIPYALASGLLPPDLSEGLLGYMMNHGSLFLGLLRCNYYPVEIGSFKDGGLPGYVTSGWDNVYAVNLIEALAQHDEAERIVLALYSKLNHGMTQGTYVSGEGATLGVVPGMEFRSMYLPPNSANNSLFLKTLRTQILHEVCDGDGMPSDLLLTHFTPRSWLENGKEIRIDQAPTLFGPVSLHVRSRLERNQVDVSFEAPVRRIPSQTWIRLRTPGRREISKVLCQGRGFEAFDAATEKIDLSGFSGRVELTVFYDAE